MNVTHPDSVCKHIATFVHIFFSVSDLIHQKRLSLLTTIVRIIYKFWQKKTCSNGIIFINYNVYIHDHGNLLLKFWVLLSYFSAFFVELFIKWFFTREDSFFWNTNILVARKLSHFPTDDPHNSNSHSLSQEAVEIEKYALWPNANTNRSKGGKWLALFN